MVWQLADVSSLWDQPRMRDVFKVRIGTVYEWRNATTKLVTEYLQAHGHRDPERALGVPVAALTQEAWEQAQARLALPALRLPNNALPLPAAFVGNKPVWSGDVVQRWGKRTGRIGQDGTGQRAKPPGRPAGVVEARPRRRRHQTAA